MATPRQLEFDWEAGEVPYLTPDEIFDRADANTLRSLKEDERVERKAPKLQGEPLGEYFSMWANTSPDGGVIISGISNIGEFIGCSSLNTGTLNRLKRTGDVFCPDARYEVKEVKVTNATGKDDFVLLFRVYYNKNRVVRTTKRKVFIRRGASKKELTDEEIRELEADKGQVAFEEEPSNLLYPKDFDTAAIHQWAANVRRMMDSGHKLSDHHILANRHLGELQDQSFVPNIACALLFAKDPRKLVPGCRIRLLRFEGETEGTGEKYNAVKDIWIEGTIPEMIARLETELTSQLRTFSRLAKDGKFYTSEEYPRLAWYEAVVNACVHRSYGNAMKNINIFVRMFDDRLEIESPGPFPPFVTPENIYERHQPRNPRLMEAMFFLGFVKMNREGTRRMRDTMAEMQLPAPEFRQHEVGHVLVRVTLRNKIKHRKVWVDSDVSELIGALLASRLSETQTRILNFIAENGEINVSQVQRLTGFYWKKAKALLTQLCAMGILEAIRTRHENERDPGARFVLRTPQPTSSNGNGL